MIFDKQSSSSPYQLMHSLVDWLRGDSLLRNSIYIMSSTIITAVIGYLYWVVATHIYSTYDIGLSSALISVMTLSSLLAELGIGATLVQTLPRNETNSSWSLTLNAGLATGILTSLLAGIVTVIALPLCSPQFAALAHNPIYAFVLIVSVPLWTISTLLDQTFIAERAASNMLVRNSAFAVLKFLFMVLLVWLATLGIIASWTLSLAVTLVGVWVLLISRLRRTYSLTIHGIVTQVRTMLSSLVWHYFINIGALAPTYLLPVLVTVRLSAADNAYYYIAWMVSSFFLIVSSAVAVSLFAEGSHVAENILRKVRSSTIIIALFLGPAMVISFLGGRYILLLFGPDYVEHALLLLMITTVAAVPDAVTNIYVSVLRVQKRLRYAALFNMSMSLLSLILTWILLPMLGITGAGWAFLISRLAGSLLVGMDILVFFVHSRWADRPRKVVQTLWKRRTYVDR
jgi:O-antigen/teichoic acid export membrane protein